MQLLLIQHGLQIGRTDGYCGPRTIAGITTFQAGFLHHPDGLVAPGGKTLARLFMAGAHQHVIQKLVPSEVPDPITRLVPSSTLGALNPGLVAANNTFMVDNLGNPRDSYSSDCQPITNERLKKQVVTTSVGPFRVQGLKPAVDSLQAVLKNIQTKQPEIYQALGTVGMLCCRYQRGSNTEISNHSWGTAVDLTLNGLLDKRGDGLVQRGLALIAPIFNDNGWYWGAAFSREDAMHFEAGKTLLKKWLPNIKP